MGNGISGSYSKPLHASDYDFNDKLLVISDILSQDSNNLFRIACETKLPYLNFILGKAR